MELRQARITSRKSLIRWGLVIIKTPSCGLPNLITGPSVVLTDSDINCLEHRFRGFWWVSWSQAPSREMEHVDAYEGSHILVPRPDRRGIPEIMA